MEHGAEWLEIIAIPVRLLFADVVGNLLILKLITVKNVFNIYL